MLALEISSLEVSTSENGGGSTVVVIMSDGSRAVAYPELDWADIAIAEDFGDYSARLAGHALARTYTRRDFDPNGYHGTGG